MHFPQKGASIGHLDALLAKTLTVAFFYWHFQKNMHTPPTEGIGISWRVEVL